MIVEISFEDILEYWRDKLWPERNSLIEPASSMLYLGGYDIAIKTRYRPRFFAFMIDEDILGVNSGHQTGETHYRSRGIWVNPEYRQSGIGHALLLAVEKAAGEAECDFLWTIPRKAAMPFYARCGFAQTSDFFGDLEFGPNCYAMKNLSPIYQGKD